MIPCRWRRCGFSYIGHSTYFIETHGGLSVATDYTGMLGPADVVPDVVTMNHAHSSHWTSAPDPRIPNVLQGWDWTGEPAEHHLDLGEMLVRNVPTDIRRPGGAVEPAGNSIFVFEVAGLCIGHLGHLHHEPTPQQYAALGRLDVCDGARGRRHDSRPADDDQGGQAAPLLHRSADALVRYGKRFRPSCRGWRTNS